MDAYINIPDNFNPETMDFDELNPQLKYMEPFSKIYKHNPKKYSSIMWCIVFFTYADEVSNRLYRLPEDERIEAIQRFYPKYNPEKPIIKAAIENFPTYFSAVQRALADEKTFLNKRGEFLRVQPYNLETCGKIDTAAAKTTKLYENFEKVEEKFLAAKLNNSEVYGGRTESYAEQKKL